jgi:hypothetical protein
MGMISERLPSVRPNASNWCVRVRPVPTAFMMSFDNWCCGESSAVVEAIMSAEPATTVSRLLKSCEMPPISWPRLSSRRRWSSWRLSPRASM